MQTEQRTQLISLCSFLYQDLAVGQIRTRCVFAGFNLFSLCLFQMALKERKKLGGGLCYDTKSLILKVYLKK